MYDVIVIGGGIAGSSCAVQIARAGKEVLLLERGRYPCHKICGEFLSTEVSSLFDRLGILPAVLAAGAQPIDQLCLTSRSGLEWRAPLPGQALGFSRYSLDKLLIDHAASCGAEVRQGAAAIDVQGDLAHGFAVHTSKQQFQGRVVLGAYGKRSAIDQAIGRVRNRRSEKFVGYKQHFSGPSPVATVEVHLFDRGYCGICPVEGSRVNVCWLAHRSLMKEFGGSKERVARQVLFQNPALARRLSQLAPIEGTLCAVGPLSLAWKGSFAGDLCQMGDGAQMIAPFCGDGMGMALRSAEIAAPLCLGLLNGDLSRNTFKQKYKNMWFTEFALRLSFGRLLQHVALSPLLSDAAIRLLQKMPAAGEWMVKHTRGAATVRQ